MAVRNVREKQNHKMADKLSEKYQNQKITDRMPEKITAKMTDRNVREMSEPIMSEKITRKIPYRWNLEIRFDKYLIKKLFSQDFLFDHSK